MTLMYEDVTPEIDFLIVISPGPNEQEAHRYPSMFANIADISNR